MTKALTLQEVCGDDCWATSDAGNGIGTAAATTAPKPGKWHFSLSYFYAKVLLIEATKSRNVLGLSA